MPQALVCTGLMISRPISMKSGRKSTIEPQEWRKIARLECFLYGIEYDPITGLEILYGKFPGKSGEPVECQGHISWMIWTYPLMLSRNFTQVFQM